MQHKNIRPTLGFTMIELLVVTTIIIVLSTIGLVSYQRVNQNARNGKRRADLETVRQALVLYRTDNTAYPTGNGTAAAFSSMITTTSNYLGATQMVDPKNTGSYVYTYQYPNGSGKFQVCTYLEPDPGTQYCVYSP